MNEELETKMIKQCAATKEGQVLLDYLRDKALQQFRGSSHQK